MEERKRYSNFIPGSETHFISCAVIYFSFPSFSQHSTSFGATPVFTTDKTSVCFSVKGSKGSIHRFFA
ncbi:hypothetical protein SLA2020_467630 [Shorea laevis]